MKTFEKPVEYLSPKEKEVIELCSEIIRWTGQTQDKTLSSEKFDLRIKATKLYETLGNIDFHNNDSYYRVYEEFSELKKDYERLKAVSNTYENLSDELEFLSNPLKKPNEKEQEMSDLCREICIWLSNVSSAHQDEAIYATEEDKRVKLKNQVRQFYELIRQRNSNKSTDTSDIKIKYEEIKKNFEERKLEREKNKIFQIKFAEEKTEEIIDGMLLRVAEYGRSTLKETASYVNSWGGDSVKIDLNKDVNNTYILVVEEFWNYAEHEPQIYLSKNTTDKLKSDKELTVDFTHYLHDYGSVWQLRLIIKNMTEEKVSPTLQFIIETIKSTPRIRKKK